MKQSIRRGGGVIVYEAPRDRNSEHVARFEACNVCSLLESDPLAKHS